jgi:hypothetical protein
MFVSRIAARLSCVAVLLVWSISARAERPRHQTPESNRPSAIVRRAAPPRDVMAPPADATASDVDASHNRSRAADSIDATATDAATHDASAVDASASGAPGQRVVKTSVTSTKHPRLGVAGCYRSGSLAGKIWAARMKRSQSVVQARAKPSPPTPRRPFPRISDAPRLSV